MLTSGLSHSWTAIVGTKFSLRIRITDYTSRKPGPIGSANPIKIKSRRIASVTAHEGQYQQPRKLRDTAARGSQLLTVQEAGEGGGEEDLVGPGPRHRADPKSGATDLLRWRPQPAAAGIRVAPTAWTKPAWRGSPGEESAAARVCVGVECSGWRGRDGKQGRE